MKVRGIPFSTPMVQALRAGLKTQTRRVITPSWARCLDLDDPEDRARAIEMCPHGQPGDQLYVREPLRPGDGLVGGPELVYYDTFTGGVRDLVEVDSHAVHWPWKARYIASRYCPRWASRTTLDLTEVRLERVQDITEEDARAEGISERVTLSDDYGSREGTMDPREVFEILWDQINGPRGWGWAANPWVFVLSWPAVEL